MSLKAAFAGAGGVDKAVAGTAGAEDVFDGIGGAVGPVAGTAGMDEAAALAGSADLARM
jgi:hypothetical protein